MSDTDNGAIADRNWTSSSRWWDENEDTNATVALLAVSRRGGRCGTSWALREIE
jgi:hypothetical protein